MAVINNLSASLLSFKINDVDSNLNNCVRTYGSAEILNGGETLENVLEYNFRIKGLKDHIIKNIIIKSLLLTEDGGLSTGENFTLSLNNIEVTTNLIASDSVKTIIPTTFNYSEEQTEDELELKLIIKNNSTNSCYYGLESILINLSDIKYAVQISFTGPNSQRNPNTIIAATLLVNRDAINITFSKDPTIEFNPNEDIIEGRTYFRKDGIYVDNYQYSINTPATNEKYGTVKLQTNLNRDENGGIIAPIDSGVAASPELVIEALNSISDLIANGIIAPADTDKFGIVKLLNAFNIDKDGGIIAPNESGIAASPQLVFNAVASLKNYTDELINGVQAPVDIEITNETKESLKEGFTFSTDFSKDNLNKIYLAWLELT